MTTHLTPETAYAHAPSIIREITWVVGEAAAYRAHGMQMSREYWLRKAAALDRVALDEADRFAADVASDAVTTAEKAAACFAELDGCDATTADPSYRPYVRREYRAWITATNGL